jgi:hypothetical protein
LRLVASVRHTPADLTDARRGFRRSLRCATDQLGAGHPVSVNRWRHRNTVRLPESLYPHAARIVDMASEHPNRAPRRTRDSSVPQCGGELLDQEGCDAVVRGPSVQNAAMKWRSPRLHGSPPNVLTTNDPAHWPVVVQLSRLLLRDRPFQSSARQAGEPGERRGYGRLVHRGLKTWVLIIVVRTSLWPSSR